MGTVYLSHLTMKAVLLFSVLASALAAPETRFLCSECVDEMHNLGFLVRAGAHDTRDYLAANYCPTVEANQQDFPLRSLLDTTLECWMRLSTTTSWMEQCISARLWASVMP